MFVGVPEILQAEFRVNPLGSKGSDMQESIGAETIGEIGEMATPVEKLKDVEK